MPVMTRLELAQSHAALANRVADLETIVSKTNPWLSAAFGHIDSKVQAGQLTWEEGDAAKAKLVSRTY